MKILHVYKNYLPTAGGIERYIHDLAISTRQQSDHDVTILVTARDSKTTRQFENGIRVIRAGRLGEIASTPLSVQLIREMGQIDADLVHLHMPYPLGEIAALQRFRRQPIVVTYHSDVVRQWYARPLYGRFVSALLARADGIIATSPPYVRTSPYLRPLASRCTVVPIGVDAPRFEIRPALSDRIKEALPGPIVLFVGRFRRYKGLDVLIDAMGDVSATALLIGDGPLKSSLANTIAARGLTKQIQIKSDVSDQDLPAYYHAAELTVLPSTQRSEAFGIVLLEAMASGRPVISTELGTGTSWVNQHGKTGLVVRPRDPQALARALNTLLTDANQREQFGQDAKNRVTANFRWDHITAQVLEVYDQAIQKHATKVAN